MFNSGLTVTAGDEKWQARGWAAAGVLLSLATTLMLVVVSYVHRDLETAMSGKDQGQYMYLDLLGIVSLFPRPDPTSPTTPAMKSGTILMYLQHAQTGPPQSFAEAPHSGRWPCIRIADVNAICRRLLWGDLEVCLHHPDSGAPFCRH